MDLEKSQQILIRTSQTPSPEICSITEPDVRLFTGARPTRLARCNELHQLPLISPQRPRTRASSTPFVNLFEPLLLPISPMIVKRSLSEPLYHSALVCSQHPKKSKHFISISEGTSPQINPQHVCMHNKSYKT